MLGKQILFWSSNVINFPAWQTDFSFGTQPQGTGDMKISNCHVYGLADMTVPVHGTYVFEKGEVSRTTAHSYWGAAGEGCVWLLMVITRDIQQIVISNRLVACWWTAWRPSVSNIQWNHVSDFWGNTSLFQLYKEWIYAKRGISNVRIRCGLQIIY